MPVWEFKDSVFEHFARVGGGPGAPPSGWRSLICSLRGDGYLALRRLAEACLEAVRECRLPSSTTSMVSNRR